MFIVRRYGECGTGHSLEEAIKDFEEGTGNYFDVDECTVYEAKEIKVQRKFEVIKED